MNLNIKNMFGKKENKTLNQNIDSTPKNPEIKEGIDGEILEATQTGQELLTDINNLLDDKETKPSNLLKSIDYIKERKEIFIGVTLALAGGIAVIDGFINHRWELQNMDVYTTKESIRTLLGGFATLIGGAMASSKVKLPNRQFN
ncbi:MAG: hypothetical protein WDK96_00885 [Candidatus Paceibacterota bacterium]|jgi:hypothetical protein